jgi:hypothetical protein
MLRSGFESAGVADVLRAVDDAEHALVRGVRLRNTLLLLAGALLLPNALAIGAGLWIGVPPRTAAMALYVLLALVCSRIPIGAVIPLYLAALTFDILLIIAHIFYLDLNLIGQNIPAFTHVRVLASPLYTELVAALVVFMATNIAFLMRFRTEMARGSRIVLGLAVIPCLLADVRLNGSANLELGPAAGIGQPFQSAVEMSGFDGLTASTQHGRNVLFVVVESLGDLRDPAQRAVLFAAFDDPALRRRYAVTTGTTPFYGPTAYGEMRELCHSRASYDIVLTAHPPTCLPAQFAALGYRTVSVHGFSSAFYDRVSWYPRIGFIRSVFQETARARYSRRCGGPFVGPCDVDIADTISDRLASATQPNFVYWLTLNSHVPVKAGEATPRHACATGGPFGDPEVCAMAEIWEDLFAAVTRLALRNPDTEILLVGDHAPPLWRRAARSLFAPDRVPWIRLAPLGPPDTPQHS